MEKKRIAVIGAGAIGGITAADMAAAGLDVTLVCKHQSIADLATGEGLHVTGMKGDRHIQVAAVKEIEDLTGTYDICLIATKAYDMPGSASRMLPFLAEDALVVSMQNGICTDALAAVVGRQRTVGCVIGWGATMHGPGELEMTSGGDFIIGRIDGKKEGLDQLKEALDPVIDTKISKDIYSELYSKLIVNACITSLGAICGLRLGEMLKHKQARSIFLAIIEEAMDVAGAMKLTVPPYGGKLRYESLSIRKGALTRLRSHLMIYIVGLKYKNLKSSSLQSLERGQKTEIDYFNGYIVEKAAEYGVNCPVNQRLCAMVKEIEDNKRTIDIKNLSDSVFLGL